MGADDDDDDPLNSDDDDESDSEDALQTDNLVLCQYDKVSRTKNRWKATLKYGVRTKHTHAYAFDEMAHTRGLVEGALKNESLFVYFPGDSSAASFELEPASHSLRSAHRGRES